MSSVFFFFQAEDGIRDTSVTGVQTCALPILAKLTSRKVGTAPPAEAATFSRSASLRSRNDRPGKASAAAFTPPPKREIGRASCRKECRSRWASYQQRKNR